MTYYCCFFAPNISLVVVSCPPPHTLTLLFHENFSIFYKNLYFLSKKEIWSSSQLCFTNKFPLFLKRLGTSLYESEIETEPVKGWVKIFRSEGLTF